MREEISAANLREGREECLEALYRLERAGETTTIEALRKSQDLSDLNIAEILLEIIERGDARMDRDVVRLRRTGRLLGRRIYRRHEVAEGFFRLLGLKRERAHREACRLEHIVSLPGERHLPDRSTDNLSVISDLFGRGAIPLVQSDRGARYRVGMVSGGHGARRKLEDLGVSKGAEITVCTKQGRGPVEITVKGSHLALGRGIAAKVLVVPVPDSPAEVGNLASSHGHHHVHEAHLHHRR